MGLFGIQYFVDNLSLVAFENNKDCRATDQIFNRVYGYSVASIIFFHLTINVGMVLGLVPVIGIPLPFLSYGGSSLWSFTVMLFILLRLDAARLQRGVQQ